MKGRGQMLVEVTVAVGVMVLVLVAAAKLTTQTIKTTRIRVNRLQANKLANACLDLVRQDKDKDVTAFFNPDHVYLKNCPCENLPGVNCMVTYLDISPSGGPKKMLVESYVYWDENGETMVESNSTTFTEVNLL